MATDPIDVARVRRWLTDLARPERLADLHMRALLRAHGLPADGPPLEAGVAAARLLRDAVDALASTGLPHRVLETCFVAGVKSRGAAARLGVSERQLSRERTRAVALLAAQLTPPDARVPCGSPPPLPDPFLARPRLADALATVLRVHRSVRVTGEPGCGKTTLVAAHAAASPATAFWYRPGPPGADGLPAFLFDLGEHLAPDDPSLASYVRGALPQLDVGLATRVALAGLARRERMLVLDDSAGGDSAVASFLAVALARLPQLTVVEIGGASPCRARLAVPPFDTDETRAFLDLAGVAVDDPVVAWLHAWTGGNARLVSAATGWLTGRAGGRGPLEDALRRRSIAMTAVRGMTGAARGLKLPA